MAGKIENKAPQAPVPKNTLRLDGSDLNRLLTDMDASTPGKHPQRAFIRWAFHKAALRVEMRQPSGTISDLHYACRNVSGTGLCLLHNSYVHEGTTCTVHMPTLAGGTSPIPGKIVRCRHVRGLVHELGVKFTKPINIRDFVTLDATKGAFTLEAVDPAKLTGVVLHIDDSAMTRRLARHHLRDTSLQVVNAETAEEGLKRAAEGFDIILCDHDLDGCPGADMIDKLRAANITTPVLMLCADMRAALQNDRRDSRPQSYLQLPLSQDQLLRALAEFLLSEGSSGEAGGSIYSTLSQDHPTYSFASEYVEDLKRQADELNKALIGEEADVVRRMCNEIRAIAPELGFACLAEAAAAATTALDASMSVADSSRQIRTVVSMCLRARVK